MSIRIVAWLLRIRSKRSKQPVLTIHVDDLLLLKKGQKGIGQGDEVSKKVKVKNPDQGRVAKRMSTCSFCIPFDLT